MIKILLASVLKPADDVRMYKKIGKTLLKAGFEVGLFGFKANEEIRDAKILYEADFSRLNFRRFFIGLKFLKAIKRFRPSSVLVCAPELLPFALLAKCRYSCRIYVDLQENYFKNLHFQEHYSFVTRHFFSHLVRLSEKIFYPFCDAFFLAEECYFEEMPFLTKNVYLLENKPLENDFSLQNCFISPPKNRQSFNFALTGTFTHTYGTSDGIELFLFLKKKYRFEGSLFLCGFAPEKVYREKLSKLCSAENISALISDKPVSQKIILETWQKADILLMPYHNNPAISGRIPTKFYEAAAAGKVVLSTKNGVREKKFAENETFLFYRDENDEIFDVLFSKKNFVKEPQNCLYFDEKKLLSVFLGNDTNSVLAE